jgi:sugar phosphate isomerase/epimerase
MPWTDVCDLEVAARIVQACGHQNAGVLIDPIHFDRGGSTFDQLATIAPQHLEYLQFCDAPAQRPGTVDEVLRQARGDRMLPGEGGLDLRGLLCTVPRGAPLSLEIPFKRTAGLTARERARLALVATQRLLAALEV